MRRWIARYGVPTVLALAAVLNAVQGAWEVAIWPAGFALYILVSDGLVRSLEQRVVAEYRAGYARGVLTALQRHEHFLLTREWRPIPTPSQVHPDDPIEEVLAG